MAQPLLDDQLWQLIAALLPLEPAKSKGGRPRLSDRAALVRHPVHSQDLWRRFKAWQRPKSGTLRIDFCLATGVTCWHAAGNALSDTTVIESLADRQFLPRYGFPIGLQKLRVLDLQKGEGDSKRDGLLS